MTATLLAVLVARVVFEAFPPLALLTVPAFPPFPPVAKLDALILPPPGLVAEKLIVAVPADPCAPVSLTPPTPPVTSRVKFNEPELPVEPVTRGDPVPLPVLLLVILSLAPLPPVAPLKALPPTPPVAEA
jgi:hypothetical protein